MVTWAHMHSYTSTDIHRHPTFQKSWCTTSHFTDRRYSFVCFYTFLCKGGLGILESPRFLSLFCQEYIFYMDVVSTTNCGVNDLLSWTRMQYENCFAVFKGNAGVRVQIIDNWTTDSDGSFFKFFIEHWNGLCICECIITIQTDCGRLVLRRSRLLNLNPWRMSSDKLP